MPCPAQQWKAQPPSVPVIRLNGDRFTAEALLSLDSFSHLEVVFHFHRVPRDEVRQPQWADELMRNYY